MNQLRVEPVDQLWRHVICTTRQHEQHTTFIFKPVLGRFGAIQYLLTSALLSDILTLIMPGSTMEMHFGHEEGSALDVVRLPRGDVVLIHKTRGRALFLTWQILDAQVRVTDHYPGREAHWILQLIEEDTEKVTEEDMEEVNKMSGMEEEMMMGTKELTKAVTRGNAIR
ncbi:uncharacterized protein LOC121856699 [Homarus americanus]|uniref:uncharacterized protein LOC121856699 n=1 Tax=Homarus americanus TaxID=6706 RepID=UPI001C466C65|nr:uncharacterized protein LOC121856699 [Homarus americanus]